MKRSSRSRKQFEPPATSPKEHVPASPQDSTGESITPSQAVPEAEGDRASFPIVGIGASAGGLEAFSELLKAVSPTLAMAFVLVPHLDPQRKSAFTQILSRSTSMLVHEVENGMKVAANNVYVIPPNCEMTISQSVLHLKEREVGRPISTTIDIFLRSLAADQGHNAIGVILSGTASDGTLGLMAIKGEGGITFAQDTQSAKYDGMPASAIAAGCVDFVLPPEAIAQELARIRQHPYVAGSMTDETEAEEASSDVHMMQIFRLLRRVTKVDFSEYKVPTIGRRIQRRMALREVEKLSEYVNLLQRDRNEVTALYHDLLINVTSFFRNSEAFDVLKQTVYPAILQYRGASTTPIRIWVPGCSTGEEAYSHAISLSEFLEDRKLDISIQIFGTDLSETAIQRARSGAYKESIESDVTPARLRRFFHKVDGMYQISKNIRDMCVFSTQNVFSDPPFSRMDLVSCRNVMIYLGQALQKRVIPTFHYALNPQGFLMIGNTEGLLGAGSDLFDLADKKHKIYRKKPGAPVTNLGFAISPRERDAATTEKIEVTPKLAETTRWPFEAQREADRLLLARYVPPAVVVNNQLDILQTRGHTGPFLELPPGKASLNLLKLARSGLLFELQESIEEARKSGSEVKRRGVAVVNDGELLATSLRVIPFQAAARNQRSFLIVFEPESTKPEPVPTLSAPLSDEERSAKERELSQIRHELAANKEYLESIIETHEATNEELQSANEEIQSANEELQSTNEELQTSKEELESANEELHTVNEEMQHRNDLLAQLNNDLTNILSSISLPMVMVGADLSVRRFTAQARVVLGLMPTDIGRPLPRLKLKIDVVNLEQMMLDVMQEVQAKQYRVQDSEGRWNSLRITPYKTLDNRIEGVVLTVVDKDELEHGSTRLRDDKPSSTAKKRVAGPSKKGHHNTAKPK
jgi:two-component system CheB/CheR fusion protein